MQKNICRFPLCFTVLFSASVLFHDCQCINIVVIAIPDLRERYRLALDIRLTLTLETVEGTIIIMPRGVAAQGIRLCVCLSVCVCIPAITAQRLQCDEN